ncbi:MAG: cysteine desulfurase family protein [Patescibacteria group bacterium]|jgi:cysteine desulfurase
MYLDYASATPVRKEALKVMLPYFSKSFGNPSSIHKMGIEAKWAIEDARRHVAELVGARPDSVVFTSGATESINLALFGALKAHRGTGRHVVVSAVEHKATLEALKNEGFEVSIVPVDRGGLVKVEDVMAVVRPDTVVVSIMAVNNEVGTVNPINEIGREILRLKKPRPGLPPPKTPLFHVDAAQAVQYLDLFVERNHIDLLSFGSAKIGGPKGVGALVISPNARIEPMLFGGNQEHGLRAGTENVPGIVGFGKASELVLAEREKEAKRLGGLRRMFIRELHREIPGAIVNGDPKLVAPHIVNVQIPGKDSEEIVLRLDAKDIFISSASACTNPSARSHVLRAMGYSEDEIRSSVRISFGHGTKRTDVFGLITALTEVSR